MKTDSYFAIGSSHFVCEDYASHKNGCVILSDGCSHGGNTNKHKTDIGARILTLAAMEHMDNLNPFQEMRFMEAVRGSADVMRRSLGLKSASLAATLLLLKHYQPTNVILGCVCGDGVIGGKKKDGSWDIEIVEFPSGAPFYLSYLMEGGMIDDYVMQFGDKVCVTSLVGDLADPEGYKKDEGYYSIQEIQCHCRDFKNPDEYEFIFIASDGINAFKKVVQTETSKHEESVALREVIPTLLRIKNFKGDFLRRHMQWQSTKDVDGTILSKGWTHEDDLSLGVIYCG